MITAAETMDKFESISEADAFDVEYWSLEQAKLGKAEEKPLARHIVVVTGGGSGIGAATAAAFRTAGAEIAVLDMNDEGRSRDRSQNARHRRRLRRHRPAGWPMPSAASSPPTAGSTSSYPTPAPPGRAIGEFDDAVLRRSFEVNFWAHQTVAREAVRVMRAQRTGGCLLFNVSKQALNPGPAFGPYGLPKAATLALMRQYAIDDGADGIRANAVNADRVRTGLSTPSMVAERAKARG